MSKAKWILFGGGLFLASLIVTGLFMYYGNNLIGADKAILYFIILIPLGLFSSSILFNVMKSYAVLKGRYAPFSLILRGPVVVFALVIYGGFYFIHNPPPPASYDLSIAFIDRKNPEKLLDGKATIRFETDIRTWTVIDGKLVYPKVRSGETIRIDPDIPKYLKLRVDTFRVPNYNTTLNVYLDQDSVRVAAIKILCAKFYAVMYAWIYDAENLSDVIGDQTNAILQRNQAAIDSLSHCINKYNKSFTELFKSRQELLHGLHELAGIDSNSIQTLSSDIDIVHSQLYDQFNSTVRNPLMDYLNGNATIDQRRNIVNVAQIISKSVPHQIESLKTTLQGIINHLPYKI